MSGETPRFKASALSLAIKVAWLEEINPVASASHVAGR